MLHCSSSRMAFVARLILSSRNKNNINMAPSLQQKRGYLRADITRVLNNITDAPDTFDETNCTATIARLTNLNDDLRKHNDTILN